MIKSVFLAPAFFRDYLNRPEIEQKADRPYILITVRLNGLLFGVPLRSNISHGYALWTDKANHCGVDFSKSVVILDEKRYIDNTRKPKIRPAEFNALRGKEHVLKQKLEKYIVEYKKAKRLPNIPRNKTLLQYSTLQYFEKYI